MCNLNVNNNKISNNNNNNNRNSHCLSELLSEAILILNDFLKYFTRIAMILALHYLSNL